MQTILNNPLASSYTLGISAGAGFGAALVIVLGAALPLPEACGGPAHGLPVRRRWPAAGVWLLGGRRGATPETLVLAGIALLFLFQALLSLLQFMASPEALQQIVFWLFGSLQRATWPQARRSSPAVLAVAVPLLLRDAWRADGAAAGRGARRGAGRRRARAAAARASSSSRSLTGVAVAFVGTIGFVGLVAPHIARMLVGEDQRCAAAGLGAGRRAAAVGRLGREQD